MKRLTSIALPVANTSHPPLPILITITSTPTLLAYSTSGSLEIQHRHAEPCSLATNEALITATVRTLSMLTPNRVAQLVKRHQAAGTLPADIILDTDAPPQPPLLPVEIRTSNGDLVEAAEFLRVELNGADDGSALLRKQLLRFDVRWQQLSSDAAELLALQRWAETNCKPGWAFYRDEVSRQSYRVSSYEAQGEGIVDHEADETDRESGEEDVLDVAA